MNEHDFRMKIPPEVHCVLEAESRVSGRDRQEIAREVLAAWAQARINGASVLQRLLRAEGVAGESEGSAGNGKGIAGRRRAGEGE